MNLMEIGTSLEMKQIEITEKQKDSENITENLNQLLQKQEESPVKIKVERDILRLNSEKAKELMRIQKQKIQTLEEEKQTLLSDMQRLKEEVQKSIEEMQRLKTEMSKTQRLNQSLQQSNDDLRNRNGLRSRKEQEKLEEEIRDVLDRNCKLQIQVNKSSVQAVDEAYKKQKEAEKQLQLSRYQAEQSRKKSEKEVQKLKKRMKLQSEKINEIKFFSVIGYIVAVVFAVCLIDICFL